MSSKGAGDILPWLLPLGTGYHSVLTLSEHCSGNVPKGMFNILSEVSAIFLCKHSQHNFYSGLNKRKAEALLVRHSGVTVQNV